MVAMPDLSVPQFIDFTHESDRFQGIAATLTKAISDHPIAQQVVLSLLSGLGLTGLAGLWNCRKERNSTLDLLIIDVCYWSLTLGWLLYALTRGFVFDRFILIWAFLLPIVWIRILPMKLLIAQYILLSLIAVRLIALWLM
jgi:hypothetical protein